MLQPTLYRATGQVLLNDPRSSDGAAADLGLYIDPGRYVRNRAEIFESPQVAMRASDILGGSVAAQEIMDDVSASASADIDSVEVTGTRPTASESVEVVNAVVQAYGEIVEEGIAAEVNNTIATLEQSKSDINAKIAGFDAQLGSDPENAAASAQRNAALAQLVTINTRIEQLSTNAALYGSGIQLYVPPEMPTDPVQPLPIRNASIALVFGLVASGAWAWWRSDRDQRSDDRNTPARILDAPLLAVVPEFRDVGATGPTPTISDPGSGAAEAYHFAVSSLGFALEQIDGTSVVVTSAAPGDGKSATALNIAIAAAQDGRNALLIDGDERARGLTTLAGKGTQHGITNIANGAAAADVIDEWAVADDVRIPFVPAGSRLRGSTAGYFRSAAFRKVLPTLEAGHDLVIVDAPPTMSAAETTDLAAQADGVLLVVRDGTAIRELQDTRQRLAMAGTPILGYVYNRAKGKVSGYGYGYGYGYGQDSS